jgi:phosphocarrier protein
VIQQTITIPNQLGLHARAAAKIVQVANKFASEITLECLPKRANAKSIMGVMMLAGTQGTDMRVSAEGADEQEALAAIVTLVQDKFGEQA